MITALWLIGWISLVDSSFRFCLNLDTFVPVGEPRAICCPRRTLFSVQSNHSVTWYRSGSDIPITTDSNFRIHQREDLLWFNPTTIEDSGLYQCVVNSTRAERKITVFNNSEDLCFNENMTYTQKLLLSNSGSLTCPDLSYFKNESTPLVVQWYKACSPGLFKDGRFKTFKEGLLINDPTENDKGIYICQATFTYMGKPYNVSRAINLIILVPPPEVRIQIIYPRNNSIKVEPGSSVVMDCNASAGGNKVFLSWEFGGEYSETYKDMQSKYMRILSSGNLTWGVKFNISEVKNENYGKYMCAAWSFSSGNSAAYIILERPVRNIQAYLIGGLVSPLFIILTALVTYRFFRIDIVLWYRASCQPLLSKGVSDGKLYDAFVFYPQHKENCAYSSDIFVLKVLPEVLEKQCGYKLFIFGRDDLPGQAVVTVVDETIKQSRRVIILLVPDSSCHSLQTLTSEHHIALYNALIRDGIKVILIELDKIKDYRNMPESIKYLQQKHGILTWRGDFSEKSLMATTKFWKNVRYQMPASQYPPSLDFPLLPVTFSSSQISEG
ncbi:interleukin-1 receptor type 1-like [Elgaria multicarinata webbii]|uniref:interleukin-1 receptor type 1-like n=1 Tax=Elgaria multicarinata webbii TaxID=159646 RepID=UPI002FCCD3C3